MSRTEMIVSYTQLKMVERVNLVNVGMYFGNRIDRLANK